MTAQLAAPTTAVAGAVMMTESEARDCVARIKTGMEDVLGLVVQLHDLNGWKALKYDSWSACVDGELGIHRSRSYQLLDLARISQAVSTFVDSPLPESHARELAPLKDDPDAVRAAYAEAIEETGGKPTAPAVRKVVDRRLARPAKTPKTRPSVSSGATAGDCHDDAPEYADQSQDAGEFEVNNEPRRGPLTSHFCSNCGSGSDHTTDLCPFGADAPLTDRGQPDAGDSSGVLPGTTDDEADASSGLAATVTPDDLSDEYPNLTAQMAKDPDLVDDPNDEQLHPYGYGVQTTDDVETAFTDADVEEMAREAGIGVAATTDSNAASEAEVERRRRQASTISNGHTGFSAGVGKSTGSKGKDSTDRAESGWHPVTVDGKAPVPVYPTAEGHINSIDSHLTGASFDEFDRLYMEHRRRVFKARALAGGQPEPSTERKPSEIVAEIGTLSPGLRRSIVSQTFDTFTDEDLVPWADRLRALLARAEGRGNEIGLARLAGAR